MRGACMNIRDICLLGGYADSVEQYLFDGSIIKFNQPEISGRGFFAGPQSRDIIDIFGIYIQKADVIFLRIFQ